MGEQTASLPDLTIETLARGFFREAASYGFKQVDYLRFVNRLLDMSMDAGGNGAAVEEAGQGGQPATSLRTDGLPLADDRVFIRAFDRGTDMDLFLRWMDDGMGRYFLLSRTTSRTLSLADIVDDPASRIGVVTLPDGTPIGSTAFLHVDEAQHKGELRKLIGEPGLRGKGYAKAASRLWIRYGLDVLGMHKIYLNTLNTNLRNIRLNEELGFRVEGILHNEVFIEGRYHDVLRMALWRE